MDWYTLTRFFAEPGRTQAGELAVYVAIPLFLAIGIFGFAVSREIEGGKTWVKYLAIVPLLWAIWYGWDYSAYAWDSFNQQAGVIGGKSELMYKASVLVPAVGILLIVAWGIISKFRGGGGEQY